MTRTARLYGGSLYDLAAEEKLTGVILEEMQEIRKIFREVPEYLHLLGEPSIPKGERTELIENAFGTQAEHYLVNFLKLLCDKKSEAGAEDRHFRAGRSVCGIRWKTA